jgi:hypothetical protein
MPETQPGYRKPDGTVDREAIRRSVEGSRVYNPQDREQVGFRCEGDEVTESWKD